MRSWITRHARRTVGAAGRRLRRDRTRWAFAIGRDRIVAVELARTLRGPRPARVLRRALDPPGDDEWPSLDAALESLPTPPARRGRDAFVALLRPLARVKVVDLPPVRAGDARALVRRNASRYFAFVGDDPVADARRHGSRRGPAVSACAPGPVARLAAERVRAAGFRVREMAPGPVALAEAARSRLPGVRRRRVAVVARSEGGTELLVLDRGVPSIFYPVPAGRSTDGVAADIGAVLRDAGRERAVDRVVLAGERNARDELRAALEARGVEVHPEERSGPGGFVSVDGDVTAAAGAARMPEAGPSLLPPEPRRRRDRRIRRRSASLGVATAALLVLAGLAHLWGLGRELDAVRARRDAIAAGVRDALESRRTLDGVRERLAAIARLERERPRWTALVADLARALPDSAHLRSFAATDSTLRVGGSAASVAVVVNALEAAPAFGSAALASPVRRDARDGRERFELTLRLADPGPATPGPLARAESAPGAARP